MPDAGWNWAALIFSPVKFSLSHGKQNILDTGRPRCCNFLSETLILCLETQCLATSSSFNKCSNCFIWPCCRFCRVPKLRIKDSAVFLQQRGNSRDFLLKLLRVFTSFVLKWLVYSKGNALCSFKEWVEVVGSGSSFLPGPTTFFFF